MKTQVSFEIGTYIKGNIYLNISCTQTCNELYQIHRTSAVSKTLTFRWHQKFQDGVTNPIDGSRPGQPRTVAIDANIAGVAGLIKRDARLTLKKYCS